MTGRTLLRLQWHENKQKESARQAESFCTIQNPSDYFLINPIPKPFHIKYPCIEICDYYTQWLLVLNADPTIDMYWHLVQSHDVGTQMLIKRLL